MPVSFSRLRIAGFKSFAEPATVEILPGLTGIVGPNGCGKSNVVEALRWAMGESSARSLRGGEMDDVIFAGTTNRPSRNLAEVTFKLDDTGGRRAPAVPRAPELEISRRIERGGGSVFRVNGREARARDVQTLFADLASGARSSAMVSQGRVGAIVHARPEERRTILEEAAGITGLHARRHEAELKLTAAEANLDRAEDVRGQLEAQLEGLQRQARQASRYRATSGLIRAAEAELMALQSARAEARRAAAKAALAAAREAQAAAAAAARDATSAAEGAAGLLPELRNREGEARTVLERRRIANEQIAGEERRARDALAAAAQRMAQIVRDLAHAEQLRSDAAAAASRLAAEDRRLADEAADHPERTARAQAALAEAAGAARAAEAGANAATERAAELVARHRALSDAAAQAEGRDRTLRADTARLAGERAGIAAQRVEPARLAAAIADREAAERGAGEARAAAETAERARQAAQSALAGAREHAAAADSARAKLAAEAQALAEVLGVKDGERWPRMVDQLTVPAGLEAALGAALGEELESGSDGSAARHWHELGPVEPAALPDGATPLASLVAGPPALSRILAAIGLVEEAAEAAGAQGRLAPGQILVSREGAVWRWDGYTVKAGTATAAAVRLQQRNRLADLRARLAEAADRADAARSARVDAEAAERAANAADQNGRTARREAEQRLERTRAAAAALSAQAATATARLAGIDEQAARVAVDAAQAAAATEQARAALAALPDPTEGRTAMERARAGLTAARNREAEARGACDTLLRAAAGREGRSRATAAERADWVLRAADAQGRVADLAARDREARAEHATAGAAPAALAARREEAQEGLQAADAGHRAAAAALAAADREAAATDRAARAAEAALGGARERVVRAESEAAQADHAWGTVAERILERLGAHPDRTPDAGQEAAKPAIPDLGGADLSDDAEDKARRKFDRLVREREAMGPVNLRAEIEAQEIEAQAGTIQREREDIATAISQAARLDRPSQPGRPRAARRGVRRSRRQLPVAVRPHVRRRAGASGDGRVRRPPARRAGNLCPAARQEAGDAVAAVRRRTGAHRAVADLRDVPLQPGTGVRARRGGRPARRRQRGPLLHPARRHGAGNRHALPGGDPPSPDHGPHGPALRRHHAGTRRVPAVVGRSAARRRDDGRTRADGGGVTGAARPPGRPNGRRGLPEPGQPAGFAASSGS